jgi:putative hydrolase of the HAD superfamily
VRKGVRPDAVLFDVGNTLLHPYPSVSHVCAEILAAAGHERDLSAIEELMPVVDEYYEDCYRADDTFWTSEEATSDVWEGMYSLLCRRLGIDDDAQAASLARSVYDEFGKAERWRPFDDVLPAFERYKAAGLKLGILSNWDGRLSGLLEGLGLSAHLDCVVCSAEVGLHKPDPRIFELACRRLGVEPGQCVHVGDHVYADVLGARAAGLRAVLICRKGAAPSVPVPVIRSLEKLDRLLG